jgi:hypothetical protein
LLTPPSLKNKGVKKQAAISSSIGSARVFQGTRAGVFAAVGAAAFVGSVVFIVVC